VLSMGIGVLGASSIVTLLAGTALAALLILIAGRKMIGQIVERDEPEAITVMH
jgi:MFS transporter, DHA1 family, multidrug resistance protein